VPESRLLSTAEAAAELGISAARVRKLIEGGQLPAERIGGRWVVKESDVKAWAAEPPGRPHHPRQL
jgi:excisionase family DNA binding protein